MRISVRSRCRASGWEPCSFCLGAARHRVVTILESHDEADARSFEVRILDGRRFVLRHHPDNDRWELAAVHGRVWRRSVRPYTPSRPNPSLTLLRAAGWALWRLAHRRAASRELPAPGAPA